MILDSSVPAKRCLSRISSSSSCASSSWVSSRSEILPFKWFPCKFTAESSSFRFLKDMKKNEFCDHVTPIMIEAVQVMGRQQFLHKGNPKGILSKTRGQTPDILRGYAHICVSLRMTSPTNLPDTTIRCRQR